MKATKNILVFWITIMFLVTFTSLLVYLVAQQLLRLGANELPSQFAIEASIKLENGLSPAEAIPSGSVDISKSLSPFILIFDKDKNLVAASAIMGKNEPIYPRGVLNYVDQKGEDRVTWQPQAGLRFATIASKIGNNYVVSGRSLKETEKLIGVIGNIVFAAWAVCVIFSSLSLLIIYVFIRKVFKKTEN